jgi:hypothetical protein
MLREPLRLLCNTAIATATATATATANATATYFTANCHCHCHCHSHCSLKPTVLMPSCRLVWTILETMIAE